VYYAVPPSRTKEFKKKHQKIFGKDETLSLTAEGGSTDDGALYLPMSITAHSCRLSSGSSIGSSIGSIRNRIGHLRVFIPLECLETGNGA
jgi:hypothetical protein